MAPKGSYAGVRKYGLDVRSARVMTKRSALVSGLSSTYTMYLASADHESGRLNSVFDWNTGSSGVPALTDLMKIPSGPSRLLAKAIRSPSGDHTGERFQPAALTKGDAPPRSRSTSHRST